MNPISAQFAWENAERRIFDYLNSKLGLIEGLTFFIADEIKGANDTDNLKILSFELSGNGEVIQIQGSQRPTSSWRMAGKLTGFFTSRQVAQETCGLIMDNIPVDKKKGSSTEWEIEGVQRFTQVSMPIISREVIPVLDDAEGSTGGQMLAWRLDWDFDCVFFNTERMM